MLCSVWDLPRPGLAPVVSCVGRQILNHCATREVLLCSFMRLSLILFKDQDPETQQGEVVRRTQKKIAAEQGLDTDMPVSEASCFPLYQGSPDLLH